jgi:transposase
MSQNKVFNLFKEETKAMTKDIKVLGIDLAKNIFQIYGTNAKGKQTLSKRVNRAQLVG